MNTDEQRSQTFRVLPLQVIETDNGFILRRGTEQFSIVGSNAVDFVSVFVALADQGRFSLDTIAQQFAGPDQEKVTFILHHLASRGMVVFDAATQDQVESGEDVFYWNHHTTREQVVANLSALRFVLIGLGRLSLSIAEALSSSGIRQLIVVDDPLLRTNDLFQSGRFTGVWPSSLEISIFPAVDWMTQKNVPGIWAIGCSDYGGRQLLLPWNEYCVEHHIPFTPVVLKDFSGSIGPNVLPGETPCYQCLFQRQNMHLEPHEMQVERAIAKEQMAVAHHPTMFTTLANLAVMRMLAVAGHFPSQNPDSVLVFDFITGESMSHRVLKIPRCPVCSSLLNYPGKDLQSLQPLPKDS